MRVRDSGMPEVSYWESLFDSPLILEQLEINSSLGNIVEFGCGYGTFTLPIAKMISGTLFAFDIDPDMIDVTQKRLQENHIENVVCQNRDVLLHGYGLPPGSMDAVLLFNILHHDNPIELLRLSAEVVRTGGSVLVIHWRYDSRTPRGPALEIRPKPEDIIDWATKTGLLQWTGDIKNLLPWHYGLQFEKI